MTGAERVRLRVLGVPCATCIIPIRRALEKTAGVSRVAANYVADLIIVDYDTSLIGEVEILKVINKVGYKAIPIH